MLPLLTRARTRRSPCVARTPHTHNPDCSLPPEFCEYGVKFETCKPWLREHAPHLYPQLLAPPAAPAGVESAGVAPPTSAASGDGGVGALTEAVAALAAVGGKKGAGGSGSDSDSDSDSDSESGEEEAAKKKSREWCALCTRLSGCRVGGGYPV